VSNELRVTFAYNRYGNDRVVENYSHAFDMSEDDEGLNELFAKFETMLVAMGYVLDGKSVNLVPAYHEPDVRPANHLKVVKNDTDHD